MARQSSQEKPERIYSNKYVEFLYQWDSTRRLKKAVPGPPENYQHPSAINGQRVPRLGKGVPPRDNQEQDFRMHRRRVVPNMSFQSHPDLLCFVPRPASAPERLNLDGTRHRGLTSSSGRHNQSSLKGAAATVMAEPTAYKPWRGRGAANPGHGLREEMIQTLSFDEQQQAARLQQQQIRRPQGKLVWQVAATPKTPVNVLMHRMSDPNTETRQPKFQVQRPVTPNLHSCSAEERHKAFYSGLEMYARNKVIGDYGSLRSSSGLRTLAGYVC